MNLISINNIEPYIKNAKKHPKKQLKQIAASIKEFGFNQPIVVDKNNVIIVGHGRYEASKILGLKKVPVLQVDLSEEQAKAYRLADNKLNESDWDMDLVIEELKGLSNEMFDLTGFDKDLIVGPDEKDDDIPEVPNKPKTKLGDIYQLGEHRIMCGDSTKKEDVDKLIQNKKASILFSSPPYNMGKGKMYENYEDNMSDNEYIQFQINVINNFCMFLDGLIFWNISYNKNNKNYYIDLMYEILHKTPFNFRELISWDKGHGMPIRQKNALTRQQEQIILLEDEKEKHIEWLFTDDNNTKKPFFKKTLKKLTNYWEIKTGKIQLNKNKDGIKHSAIFPVALPTKAIIISSKENEIVLEPFLGSGSTLIAAEKTNRICYGMELDPKYVDVSIQRWIDYTDNETIIKNGKKIKWSKKQ